MKIVELLLGFALALVAGPPEQLAVRPVDSSLTRQAIELMSFRRALESKQMEQVLAVYGREKKRGRQKEMVRPLVEGLHSRDKDVRWLSARVLARVGADGAEAIPHLIEATKDADPMVRWSAADALCGIAPKNQAGLDLLMQALDDTDPMVRWSALKAVAEVGPSAKRAAPVVVQLLQDESLMVRREAARTLKAVSPHLTSVGMNEFKP